MKKNRRRIFRVLFLLCFIVAAYFAYHVFRYLQKDVMLRHYLIYNSWPALQDQMFGAPEPALDSTTSIHPEENRYKVSTINITWSDSVEAQLQADLQRNLEEEVTIEKSKNPWHPITISDGTNTYEAKVRLRGDMLDNYLHGLENASMRINFTEELSLWGFRKISLIRPFHENGCFGMAYYHFMQKLGYAANEFGFASVNINGKETGIWIFQEGFTENLYRKAGHEKGILFRFENDCQELDGTFNPSGFPKLDPYQSKQLQADTMLQAKYASLLHKLQQLKSGELPANAIFNLEMWGRFVAVSDIFYGHHAMACHNTRLYFNVDRDRLEPVAWDPKTYQFLPYDSPLTFFSYHAEDYPIYKVLSQDTTFVKHYVSELRKFITSNEIPQYVDQIQKFTNHIQPELTEPKMPPRLDSRYFIKTQNILKDQLHIENPVSALIEIGDPYITIWNNSLLPIYVHSITWEEDGIQKSELIDRVLYQSLQVRLQGQERNEYQIHYKLPDEATLRSMKGM